MKIPDKYVFGSLIFFLITSLLFAFVVMEDRIIIALSGSLITLLAA